MRCDGLRRKPDETDGSEDKGLGGISKSCSDEDIVDGAREEEVAFW